METAVSRADVAAVFARVLNQVGSATLVSPRRLVFMARNGTVFAAHEVADMPSGGFRFEFIVEHVIGGVARMPAVVVVIDAHDKTAVWRPRVMDGGHLVH
jgi:hypothetical protein